MSVKHEGTFTVDSGTVMVGDPCYTVGKIQSWESFNRLLETQGIDQKAIVQLKGQGIVSRTHYGDGTYNLFSIINKNNETVGLIVSFEGGEPDSDLGTMLNSIKHPKAR